MWGNKASIVKIIDNFENHKTYLQGFNRLGNDDVVVVERLKDGEKTTEGVLVSDFVSDDSFSNFGSPSQRLELLKKNFRSSTELSAVQIIPEKDKDESPALIKPKDTVVVKKTFSDQPATSIRVSVQDFLSSSSFAQFGSSEERMQYLEEHFYGIDLGALTFFKPSAPSKTKSQEDGAESFLEDKVDRLEASQTKALPPPVQASIVIQEYKEKEPARPGTLAQKETVVGKTVWVVFGDPSRRDKVVLRIHIDDDNRLVAFAASPKTCMIYGRKGELIDLDQLKKYGIDFQRLFEGHSTRIEMSPPAIAYFWKLTQKLI